MQNQHIQRLLEKDYQFKFGDYISHGFNILGKNLGGFVVFGLLAGIIIMTAGFIPIFGGLAANLILTPALLAGVYIVANKVERREDREFSDFFNGFQYVPQLALVALVSGMIILLSLIPFGFANVNIVSWFMGFFTEGLMDPEMFLDDFPGFSNWTLLLLLPAIYFSVAYAWSGMFVVFHKLSFWDAMEASRIMITKKWFIFFLFMLVTGLIGGLGVLGLFIGILFTYPAMLCMHYAAFSDVTELNQASEDIDILDHLVD